LCEEQKFESLFAENLPFDHSSEIILLWFSSFINAKTWWLNLALTKQ